MLRFYKKAPLSPALWNFWWWVWETLGNNMKTPGTTPVLWQWKPLRKNTTQRSNASSSKAPWENAP